jgi:hypothetical protein
MAMYFLDGYLAYNRYPQEMIDNKEAGPLGTVLRIPNYVIRTIYWEQYFQKVSERKKY